MRKTNRVVCSSPVAAACALAATSICCASGGQVASAPSGLPAGYYQVPVGALTSEGHEHTTGPHTWRVELPDFERHLDMVRIAESVYPPRDVVLRHAGRGLDGWRAPSEDERLWWYGADPVRFPYAITADAVAYFRDLHERLDQGESYYGITRSSFRYRATVDYAIWFVLNDQTFENVNVVRLELSWSHACGTRCGNFFVKDRVVLIAPDGSVVAVTGDGVRLVGVH